MNAKNNKKVRPGVALLVVLFIVMAITILSLGFVSRSDIELACGQNMLIRTQMDYLAESGLEHARGLILNPQDVSTEYWAGNTRLQLLPGNDYYDVTVTQDANDRCNYIIVCNAYREEGVERIGLSCFQAELRLDPYIAYWTGSDTTVWPQMTINGDVYCNGNVSNNGTVNGDVFAAVPITGTGTTKGQEKGPVAPVAWPDLESIDFDTIKDVIISQNIPQGISDGICYGAGDVNMPDNVTINGTLVVAGDLTISGSNNVITAEPNFPALVIGGQVLMKDGSSLEINGLAQIGGTVTVDPNDPNPTITPRIDVNGSLCIAGGGVTSPDKIIVNITAAPEIASIETWFDAGASKRWSPAAGAFFRSIERIP